MIGFDTGENELSTVRGFLIGAGVVMPPGAGPRSLTRREEDAARRGAMTARVWRARIPHRPALRRQFPYSRGELSQSTVRWPYPNQHFFDQLVPFLKRGPTRRSAASVRRSFTASTYRGTNCIHHRLVEIAGIITCQLQTAHSCLYESNFWREHDDSSAFSRSTQLSRHIVEFNVFHD